MKNAGSWTPNSGKPRSERFRNPQDCGPRPDLLPASLGPRAKGEGAAFSLRTNLPHKTMVPTGHEQGASGQRLGLGGLIFLTLPWRQLR